MRYLKLCTVEEICHVTCDCTYLLVSTAKVYGNELIGKVVESIHYNNNHLEYKSHLRIISKMNNRLTDFLEDYFTEVSASTTNTDDLRAINSLDFCYVEKYVGESQDGSTYEAIKRDCSKLAMIAHSELTRRATRRR